MVAASRLLLHVREPMQGLAAAAGSGLPQFAQRARLQGSRSGNPTPPPLRLRFAGAIMRAPVLLALLALAGAAAAGRDLLAQGEAASGDCWSRAPPPPGLCSYNKL